MVTIRLLSRWMDRGGGEIWISDLVDPAQSPGTFEEWQSTHGLEGKNAAEDDFDADGWSNLVEFALWMKADTAGLVGEDGTTPNRGVHMLINEDSGKVGLEFMRPRELQGIHYRILVGTSPGEWEELEGEPTETDLQNGAVRVCYPDLEDFVEFFDNRFFVRIDVTELE